MYFFFTWNSILNVSFSSSNLKLSSLFLSCDRCSEHFRGDLGESTIPKNQSCEILQCITFCSYHYLILNCIFPPKGGLYKIDHTVFSRYFLLDRDGRNNANFSVVNQKLKSFCAKCQINIFNSSTVNFFFTISIKFDGISMEILNFFIILSMSFLHETAFWPYLTSPLFEIFQSFAERNNIFSVIYALESTRKKNNQICKKCMYLTINWKMYLKVYSFTIID